MNKGHICDAVDSNYCHPPFPLSLVNSKNSIIFTGHPSNWCELERLTEIHCKLPETEF